MEAQWALPGNTGMTATAATAFQAQGGYAIEIKVAAAGGAGGLLVDGILVNGLLARGLAG